MVTETGRLLEYVYLPLMWACVSIHVLFGAAGLLSPHSVISTARVFTRDRAVRVAGVLLLAVGAVMFASAGAARHPLLPKAMGVVLFVDGGVRMILPTVHVMLAEWTASREAPALRLMALTSFGMAYLFYLASRLPVTAPVM